VVVPMLVPGVGHRVDRAPVRPAAGGRRLAAACGRPRRRPPG